MRQADKLLGANIFPDPDMETYLNEMAKYYGEDTEPVEPNATVPKGWCMVIPSYAEVAWEVEHIMESRRELDLPAWSREEAEAFLKEKQSAIRSIVWDAGEVYIRDMMRSEHQCPECERDLNPDATRCHDCNPYEVTL